jgi:predicted RNA-binding protein with PUA-like domain
MPAKKAARTAPKSLPYEQGKWAAVFAPRAKGEKRYWLVKSEPDSFSFDDLMASEGKTTCWDGVRNTAARNFLRDGMKRGDGVLYYHSMAEPPAVVGLCTVVREGYPDPSAFDARHEYFDEDSDPSTPMWFAVDVRGDKKLKRPVTLAEIKANAELSEMALLKVSRLSVVPVTPDEWRIINDMGK